MSSTQFGAFSALVILAAACATPVDDTGGATDIGATNDVGTAVDSNVAPQDTVGTSGGTSGGTVDSAGETDEDAEDTGGSSSGGADVAEDAVNLECPGAPGCECKDNSDCDNGLCLEDWDTDNTTGKVCATPCIDSCAPGKKCIQISGSGGDTASVCAPTWGHICRPCTADKDCNALGGAGSKCVDQGNLGAFCGAPCSETADCPTDYTCEDTTSVDFAKSKQCVRKPDADSADKYGTCPCTNAAKKAQFTTACTVEKTDDSGKVIGSCAGERSCLATGLGKCVAPEISKEICDLKDNDCDGEVDNGACDDGDACTTDACPAKGGDCQFTPVSNGLACDADGTVCTESDSCQNGKCTAGAVQDCDDKNPCTTDTCDLATGCTQTQADGKACDDDNPCTIGDVCATGSCKSGVPKTCTSTNSCILASCSPTKDGKCVLKNALDGLPCNDGNACTDKDACADGNCSPKAIVDCDDGNVCSEESCDNTEGCVYKDNAKPCEDGTDKCVSGMKCKDTICAGGVTKDCDDKELCTIDSCDAKTGECKHDAKGADDKECSDNDACTGDDKCAAGKCAGTAGKGCDDGNPCTIDTCDTKTGACKFDSAAMDAKSCDADSDGCTKDDVCNAGKCIAGEKVTCAASGDPCQSNTCASIAANKSACVLKSADDGDLCDDNNACMDKDACKSGKCAGSLAKKCDDNNACTDDSCDPKAGCVFANNTKPCADNNACTTKEVCNSGACKKTDLVCDDGNACTKDDCDPAKGCQTEDVADQITCSQDGKMWCKSGKCETKPDPNKGPTAKLTCPSGGFVGDSLTFDAAGSVDPDGKIAAYFWDWNDTTNSNGVSSKVAHKWAKDGVFTVALTVTDDKGAKGVASCKVTISKKPTNPPVVELIAPSGDFSATQGEAINATVDVTAKAGKSIKNVQLLVDGAVVATDSSLPYSFTWNVPKAAKTASKHTFAARATDSEGSVGTSKVLNWTVRNDKPTAAFSATVTGKLKVAVDAGYSKDTETTTDKLLVRFDWENDGTFDTVWQAQKKHVFTYGKEGTYTIKMQVKDEDNQIAETTRKVSLSLVQQVSGTIKTTTWTGTIIVTGDIIVPKGQVLTIASGTSVLFVPIDQDKDGVGDLDIFVYGKLKVEGADTEPVTFSTYGATKKAGKDWGRIQLKGEGSAINHALVEFANMGLELMDASSAANTHLRNNTYGIFSHAGAKGTLTNISTTDNLRDGLQLQGAVQLTFNGLTATANKRYGVYIPGSSTATKVIINKGVIDKNLKDGVYVASAVSSVSFTLADSQVKSNGGAGLYLVGGMVGSITRNNILYNAFEGIRIAPYKTWDVQAKINLNNIFGNALKAAWKHQKISLTATKSGYGSGTASSAAWGTPKGEKLDFVRFSYTETDYYKNYYVNTAVRADSTSGSTLFSSTSNVATEWLNFAAKLKSKIVVQVNKTTSSSSYKGTATVSGVVYSVAGLKREISVIHQAKTVDMRKNFYGVFPDVLPVMTLDSAAAANVHGFTGKAFDGKWTVGPYRGGETIQKPETWPPTVWVTGDLTINSGNTVTVNAGTKINVVRHDQDSDGYGDLNVYVYGRLQLLGEEGKEVHVTSVGSKQIAGRDYQRVRFKGQGSTVQHTIVEYGQYGLELYDTTKVADTITRNTDYGVAIRSPGGAVLTNWTSEKNRINGLLVSSGGVVTANSSSVIDNLGDGVSVTSSSSATSVTLTKSDISKNNGRGVRVASSGSAMKFNLTDSTVKSNGKAGVSVRGGMTGSVTKNNILYNGYEGVRVSAYSVYDVQTVISRNNIFGNALKGAWLYKALGLAAVKSGYGSGAATSSAFATPKGEVIDLLQWSYSETDYYKNYYVSGALRKDSGSGSQLAATTSNVSKRWHDASTQNAKKVVAQTNKTTSSSSYKGTTTIHGAVWTQAGLKREISVITNSKTVDVRHNYFGVFPDILAVVTLSSPTAANLHGFVGKAFDNTWSKGPYYGGETLAANVTWKGEVWLTGDLIVPTGKVLTVAAATTVHVVKYDVAKDGIGDIDATINGTLDVQGTAGKGVKFVEQGGSGKAGSWYRIRVTGSGSKALLKYATFGHAVTALQLESGAHVLDHVTVAKTQSNGLLVTSASNVKANDTVVTEAGGHGVHVQSSSGVTFDKLTSNKNKGHGLHIAAAKTGLKFSNVTATGNANAGLSCDRCSATVSDCDLTGNRLGAWYHQDSAGSLSKCNVKGNTSEGILLSGHALLNPAVKINDNNIFGNATKDGGQFVDINVTASKTGYGSGTASSAVWTAPYYDIKKTKRAEVVSLRSQYDETDYYKNYYVSGFVRKDSSSGSQLISQTSDWTTRWWWLEGKGATKLVAQVSKSTSSSSYKGTVWLYNAYYRAEGKKIELAAATDKGKVSCTGNYWGGFDGLAGKFALSRTDAVDYQGFAVIEKPAGAK